MTLNIAELMTPPEITINGRPVRTKVESCVLTWPADGKGPTRIDIQLPEEEITLK